MNPADIVFEAFSNLTGGLVTDLQTAVVALVGLMVMVIGLKKLQSLLLDRNLDAALEDAYKKQGWSGIEGDIQKARYKKLLDLKIRRMTGGEDL